MAIGGAVSASASDLSPVNWPEEIRETAEKAESVGMTPQESRVHAGKNVAISGTASAISAAAGLVPQQNGGNAAAAATAVAMTGITTPFGSAVSYARIMAMRDRKSVVSGKSVSVRVDFGGRRNLK